MAKIVIEDSENFEPIDVSEPREVRRERDLIAEERAYFRRMWLREHRIYIFALIGVLLVLLIFLGVRTYHNTTNPWSRFKQASAKDFGTSFRFTMDTAVDGQSVMTYSGSADIDRGKQQLRILYDAQYTDYSYTAAAVADGTVYASGSLYDGVWRVRENAEKVHDFFDFDTDYRKGTFDAGAFLRFTELNSDYFAGELQRFVKTLEERLSGNSALATVTTTKSDGDTLYHYDFDMKTLMEMITNEGASVFYRSTDYDHFRKKYAANEGVVEKSSCALEYTIDGSGYMTALSVDMTIGEQSYAVRMTAFDFGNAATELPEDFLSEAAKLNESEEQ